VAGAGFYDAGALRHVAINLFYGWGYNFYRLENQLRADDQLVRAQAAALLGQALAAVQAAESDWRREKLPPPSRAHPFPDPEAVAAAQALERLGRGIGALEGRLHALPAPENDRMSQRHRQEAQTLTALIDCDEQLVGQAELMRAMVQGQAGGWILEHLADLEAGLAAIGETLARRETALTGRST
jgi:hypothetical protein